MSNREAAPPLFTLNGSGWLEYAPLRHHKLPSLVYANSSLDEDETDAVFVSRRRKGWSGSTSMSPEEAAGRAKKDGEEDVMFRRRLYRLDWAGMSSVAYRNGDDSLPCELLQHWSGEIAEAARLKLRADGSSARMTMLDVMALRDRDGLLEQLPETVAYHIAVARQGDPLMCPVANLPGMVVRSVIDARFALDANYQAAATYLKWLAETHWEHPLLQGFDTAVSDHLTNISTEATRLYFYMLGDTLYDKETQFYARGPVSEWWDRLACYLFWVGRTGMGVYTRLADWPDDEDRRWKDFAAAFPGIVERIEFYRERGYRAARTLARVDGRDPAVGFMTADALDDANLIVILPQLEKLIEETKKAGGMTALGILDALYPKEGPPVGHQELRDCIEQITGCRMGQRPEAVKLGKYLQKRCGRRALGRYLEKSAGGPGGAVTWRVRRVEPQESS
jgi:hypothetical protein